VGLFSVAGPADLCGVWGYRVGGGALSVAVAAVRERRGLGLGTGSRSQTGEAQARGHYDGRCCDTCDAFLHRWFSMHVTNDTNVTVDTTVTIEVQVANGHFGHFR